MEICQLLGGFGYGMMLYWTNQEVVCPFSLASGQGSSSQGQVVAFCAA
jgi:hypothetical protein